MYKPLKKSPDNQCADCIRIEVVREDYLFNKEELDEPNKVLQLRFDKES